MIRLRPLRAVLAILGVAMATAVGACLLPDDPYQRWQLLDGTIHANARWIYERCHFDPTPIDVAFIGPSRTALGVNAPRLAANLAARGVTAQVVNFSLPEAGRNINYLVAHELLETKHPKLIILGVTEKPSRFGHPAFKFIAPSALIVDPGYFADANYFSDLIYLPYRQIELFLADLSPDVGGLRKRFDPALYAGVSQDNTGNVKLPDGTIKNGESPASAAELARGVHKLESGNHPPILPGRYADIEFGDERHYLTQIAREAQARGSKVMFLFLPYYTGTSTVQEQAFYERFGPVLNAGYLARHAEWYMDYGHLTRTGAEHVTDWLTGPVAAALNPSEPARGPEPGPLPTHPNP
jgi:hypothetical protein